MTAPDRHWPVILAVSAVAVQLLFTIESPSPLRVALVLWFLLFCPGMAVVRLLELEDVLARWVLALGLSLGLNGIVSGIALYAGLWSVEGMLSVLAGITLVGAGLQTRWRTMPEVHPLVPALGLASVALAWLTVMDERQIVVAMGIGVALIAIALEVYDQRARRSAPALLTPPRAEHLSRSEVGRTDRVHGAYEEAFLPTGAEPVVLDGADRPPSSLVSLPVGEAAEISIAGLGDQPGRLRPQERTSRLAGGRHSHHPRNVQEPIVFRRTIVVSAIVLVLSLGMGVAIGVLEWDDPSPLADRNSREPATEEGAASGQGSVTPQGARSATPAEAAPATPPADGSASPPCSRSLFGCAAQPNLPGPAGLAGTATPAAEANGTSNPQRGAPTAKP